LVINCVEKGCRRPGILLASAKKYDAGQTNPVNRTDLLIQENEMETKNFLVKKKIHLIGGLTQVLVSNLYIYATTKDITGKPTSP